MVTSRPMIWQGSRLSSHSISVKLLSGDIFPSPRLVGFENNSDGCYRPRGQGLAKAQFFARAERSGNRLDHLGAVRQNAPIRKRRVRRGYKATPHASIEATKGRDESGTILRKALARQGDGSPMPPAILMGPGMGKKSSMITSIAIRFRGRF